MINWLKKLMLFRLLILAIYLKKHTATQKWQELKKMTGPDKYITTLKFKVS